MLHFILPVLVFSSRSHHSFWAMLMPWVGGNQVDTVRTVWADAEPAATAAAAARKNFRRFMRKTPSGLPSNVRAAPLGHGPDLPGLADQAVGIHRACA